jgi:hypothetical protein
MEPVWVALMASLGVVLAMVGLCWWVLQGVRSAKRTTTTTTTNDDETEEEPC